MAADQERADRIRALKQERPDLTWRRIADHVGVTERSATDWQRKGGMEYDNAKKLAELFEVDVDYIWRGAESDTPTPFAGQDGLADQLDAIQRHLADQAARLERIELMLLGKADSTLVSGEDLTGQLDRLEQTLAAAVSEQVGDAAERLEASVAEARSILRAASQGQQRAASKRAPKRTRAA